MGKRKRTTTQCPAPESPPLDHELRDMKDLLHDIDDDANVAAKRARAQHNARNRKPGRPEL